jgi:hypothetical protein
MYRDVHVQEVARPNIDPLLVTQPKIGPCSTGDEEDGGLERVIMPRRSGPGENDAIGHAQMAAARTGLRDAELAGDALAGAILAVRRMHHTVVLWRL